MDIKIINKLLKVLELTKRGVDGEKTSAEALLNNLLKKHNLELSDLETLTKQQRYYKYTSADSKSIIIQIIVSITPDAPLYAVRGEKYLVIDATDAEHLQITELIDFHLYNYKIERAKLLKTFRIAYIQKHQLFRPGPADDRTPKTAAELEQIRNMFKLKETLSDNTYHKKLNK